MKLTNEKYYFTNEPCKNGHIDKRYINTNICYSCKRLQNKRYTKNHPKVTKKISQKTYFKNKEKHLKNSKKWAKLNPEKVKQIKKNYKIRNKEKYLEQCRVYSKNKRKDINYKLHKNISKQIWNKIKNKKGSSILDILPYDFNQLKNHLESQFTIEMNWDNYGIFWEIDHIIPSSWFFGSDIIECWNLNNLQPLECNLNRSKQNKNNKTRDQIIEDFLTNVNRLENKEFKTIQNRITESNIRLLHGTLGLSTESNELLDMLKKHLFYGKPIDRKKVIDEVGDVLFYMAVIIDEIGSSFEEVMIMNVAKLKARFPEKFTEDQAINRDTEKERKILEETLKIYRPK